MVNSTGDERLLRFHGQTLRAASSASARTRPWQKRRYNNQEAWLKSILCYKVCSLFSPVKRLTRCYEEDVASNRP